VAWERSPAGCCGCLCLMSGTCGGLPKKHCDTLRSEFLAAYGHQHLLTLNNLERSGGALLLLTWLSLCMVHKHHAM